MSTLFKRKSLGLETQWLWLRALAVCPENPSSVFSTHTTTYNHLSPSLRESYTPFWPLWDQARAWYSDKTPIHIKSKKKSSKKKEKALTLQLSQHGPSAHTEPTGSLQVLGSQHGGGWSPQP